MFTPHLSAYIPKALITLEEIWLCALLNICYKNFVNGLAKI